MTQRRVADPAVAVAGIAQSILLLRGRRVVLDADLAQIYGVATRRLNEQVRRNRDRFPVDFLVELVREDLALLKSQNATSRWGGRRTLPLAFTEHGALMAATVLSSPRAVEMSVFVVRAFVQLRQLVATNRDLARRLDELEASLQRKLATHDQAIAAILSAIRELTQPVTPERRGIGFTADISGR